MKKVIILFFLIVITKIVIAQADTIISDVLYKEFKYQNGSIASKGYLINNLPTGYWISYYITGIKKSEGKWLNNKLDSIWIFYDQLGDTAQKISYYQGKKNGYHYKFFTISNYKNIRSSKELYVNGKRNGKAIYYYETGQKKEIVPYLDDKKQGIGFKYDLNNNIIAIIRYRNNEIIVQENINRYNTNGNKEGIWKTFYESGTIKDEKQYLNGKLNGYLKLYNKEGKLTESIKFTNGEVDLNSKDFDTNIEIKEEYDNYNNLIFQGSFNNEVPIGIHRNFDNNGKVIKSETYNINGSIIAKGIVLITGLESGEWIYYYEDGKTKAQGKFINGKKTGEWSYFYPSGKLQQKGSYFNGKLAGIWRWYYETGELLKEEYYIFGKLDGEVAEYDEKGNIISKGNYIEGNKEGKWIYIVGDQKYSGNYVLDQKDGEWISYYTNEENLSFKGKFIQGNPDGKHEYYYPNGVIKEERYYSEGEKVKSWSKYNENGELFIVVQYKEGREFKINGVRIKLDDKET